MRFHTQGMTPIFVTRNEDGTLNLQFANGDFLTPTEFRELSARVEKGYGELEDSIIIDINDYRRRRVG